MFRAPRSLSGIVGRTNSISVIPPRAIGERPQIDLECPRGSVLLREVDVGLRDVRRKHESVMFVAPGISQLLELFRAEHFSQGVGRIHRAVDQDMYDVNPFRCKLSVECLAEHSPSAHRSSM